MIRCYIRYGCFLYDWYKSHVAGEKDLVAMMEVGFDKKRDKKFILKSGSLYKEVFNLLAICYYRAYEADSKEILSRQANWSRLTFEKAPTMISLRNDLPQAFVLLTQLSKAMGEIWPKMIEQNPDEYEERRLMGEDLAVILRNSSRMWIEDRDQFFVSPQMQLIFLGLCFLSFLGGVLFEERALER